MDDPTKPGLTVHMAWNGTDKHALLSQGLSPGGAIARIEFLTQQHEIKGGYYSEKDKAYIVIMEVINHEIRLWDGDKYVDLNENEIGKFDSAFKWYETVGNRWPPGIVSHDQVENNLKMAAENFKIFADKEKQL